MAKNDPSNLWDVLLAFESHAREALRRKHPSTVHEAARNVLRYAGLVRFSLGKAIGAANPSGVTDAVSAAISLGCYFTGMLAKDMEPHAKRGHKVRGGEQLGHAKVHGTTEQKTARWGEYVAAFDKLWQPGHKRNPAYTKVARQFGVNRETIARAVRRRDQG